MHNVAVASIHVAAIFATCISAAMLIPTAVDLYYGRPEWQVFFVSALFSGGGAMAVALATHGQEPPASARFGFMLVI